MRLPRFCLALPLVLLAGCGGGGSILTRPGPTKWTVLVYLNASNDLYPDSDFNVEEMQKAAGNAQVRIILQWKQSQSINPGSSFDGTRRYLVVSQTGAATDNQLLQNLGKGIDMGNPKTLSDFIAWGKTNYPADRYALVLWDHGNGWRPRQRDHRKKPAFSYDFQTGNAIEIWQLPQALGSQQFDMIVWDCSLMQMCEVAYQLHSNAKYVVGTEESPPAAGFPYDVALGRFQSFPDASSLSLAESWVDAMNDAPGYSTDPIEESVVDTSKLPALCAANGAIDLFAAQLIQNLPSIDTETQEIRAVGKSYDKMVTPPRYFFDLVDVASRYRNASPEAGIQTTAANIMQSVKSAVVYERHNNNSVGSHGLSIDFSPSTDFVPVASDYGQMAFGSANRWAQWLFVAP